MVAPPRFYVQPLPNGRWAVRDRTRRDRYGHVIVCALPERADADGRRIVLASQHAA